MTFQQLHYLMEVYRTGSVSKAAEKLFVSRPSVSITINTLEEELGYPIFFRTAQGLTPTSQGKQFLEYAAKITETQRLMAQIGKETKSRFVIAASNHPPINNAIANLIDAHRDNRELSFTIDKCSYAKMPERLRTLDLDIFISWQFEQNMLEQESLLEKHGLKRKVHETLPCVICIGPGHRLYHKPDLSPRDLERDRFIDTQNSELFSYRPIRSIMRIDPELVLPSTNVAISNELIRRGIAYTIRRMPPKDIIEEFGFRCIPIEGIARHLVSIWNPANPLLPVIEQLMALLDEEVAGG